MGRLLQLGWGLVLVALLAGCGGLPGRPSKTLALGDVLAELDFRQPFQWEFYRDSTRGIDFGIEDRAYRARIDGENGALAWALNGTSHTDVVIQADTLPFAAEGENGYGLMCRAGADNNGDGYYFLISDNGAFTIRRGVNGVVEAIIAWTPSGLIQTGNALNRMRIACIGDYLALYVNGEFVAEAYDRRYQTGFAGIAAVVPEGNTLDISFDNLTIWEGAIAGEN